MNTVMVNASQSLTGNETEMKPDLAAQELPVAAAGSPVIINESGAEVAESDAARQQLAENAHAEIIESLTKLHQDWVSLVRKVQHFRDEKLFHYIVDPETQKPFTTLHDWGRYALGISASRLFADLQVIDVLSGVVEDCQLSKISKRNCYLLTQRKLANLEVDAAVINDATTLTFSQLTQRYPTPPGRAATKKHQVTLHLSRETARLLRKALTAAKDRLKRMGEPASDDASVFAIIQGFIAFTGMDDSHSPIIEADPSGSASTEHIM